MIRYEFDPADLQADVDKLDAKWTNKAATRTKKFIRLAEFQEKSSIWSLVKPAFMKLQMNKCAFCERQFESVDYGKIEFDLEHFRPKSSVVEWPDVNRHSHLTYAFPTGKAYGNGYYWLAYDLQNYAASCKVCNTVFKLNYFPIAASRGRAAQSVSDLAREEPFLCYPLGSSDDDPEELVTFVATTAVPAKRSGPRAKRGKIIIDFFGLNEREQLHRERARMIGLFGSALQAIDAGAATSADRKIVARMHEPRLPHAGCIRAFKRLWEADRTTARRAYELCRAFSVSGIGTDPPDL